LKAKTWVIIWFLTLLFSVPIIGITNYYIDPYGLLSTKNKYIDNVTGLNNPTITNMKVELRADYYLIGTSRLIRVHPDIIEKYLNKKTYNINIAGATFRENYLLARKVKTNKKNFIFGFDAFSLNKNRLAYSEILNRVSSYESKLLKNFTMHNYMTSQFINASKNHILRQIKNEHYERYFIDENIENENFTLNSISKHLGLDNGDKKKVFANFDIYSESEIIHMAKIASKDDYFLIYPKHYYHYLLFQKHNDIEKKYFRAIQLLVENTSAQVWSFYGINEITKNKNNFDEEGWHFKPKVSDMIFKNIFDSNIEKKYGKLITKDNVIEYLSEQNRYIKNYVLE